MDRGEGHALRCVRNEVEELLFAGRRGLFSGLDLISCDASTAHFHGEGGQTLRRYGKSKDFCPHCKQVILGLALDSEGCPLCMEMAGQHGGRRCCTQRTACGSASA